MASSNSALVRFISELVKVPRVYQFHHLGSLSECKGNAFCAIAQKTLPIIYRKSVISIIYAVAVERFPGIPQTDLSCVVQVVGALATRTIGTSGFLQFQRTCHDGIVITIATSQVVAGDDRHVVSHLRDVGQSDQETRKPHVETGIAIKYRTVGLPVRPIRLMKDVFVARKGDGTPLALRLTRSVKLGYAIDGRKSEFRRQ